MNMNDLLKAVMALDLNPIKAKLMHAASGEGWSLEKASAVEKEYRRFLCLMKLYPDAETAPLVDVDTFWHYHILDTMKYAADCEQVFGYFLHHYPYVGLRGDGDEQFRVDSGERMRTLYEATFGEAYPVVQEASVPGAIEFASLDQTAARAMTAWCAGPAARKTAIAEGAMTAWCAGPAARQAAGVIGAIAWCAGPAAKRTAHVPGSATAWCAGPAAQRIAKPAENSAANVAPAGIAWCAGPAAQAQATRTQLAA